MFQTALKAARDPAFAIRATRARLRKHLQNREQECRNRPDYLAHLFDTPVQKIREYEDDLQDATEFKTEFEERKQELIDADAITGTTSYEDCETMYLVCRILEPTTVVETGVLYGAFDAHILLALEHNSHGGLYSLDLPEGPKSDYEYGYLIPDAYRDRWNLKLGNAQEVLNEWAAELAPIDLFLHDSLHTVNHMKYEYETVYPHVREGGVIATHDVLLSNVFERFTSKYEMAQESIVNTGISIK